MTARQLTQGEEKQTKSRLAKQSKKGKHLHTVTDSIFSFNEGADASSTQSRSTLLCSEAALGGLSCSRTPGVWVCLVGDDSYYPWSWPCFHDGHGPPGSPSFFLLWRLLSLSSGTISYLFLLQTQWCWLRVPQLAFGFHKRHWTFLYLHHASANSTLTISFVLNKTITKNKKPQNTKDSFIWFYTSEYFACTYVCVPHMWLVLTKTLITWN